MITFLFLILPGLIAGYFLFLRPVLHALPQFKKFYDEADGFWAKVSALGGHSITIAWGYFMAGVGVVAQWIEPIGNMVGDPDLKAQITDTLQANPKILGYVLMGISAVTIAARLRSIAKGG
jgi:hypothetical protein